MCNYPNHILITLKHKETGKVVYTFDHWNSGGDKYATIHDLPSHQTQVISYYPVDDFEVIDRRGWNEDSSLQ